MTDNLKERLADMAVLSQSRTPKDALKRIEELEAERNKLQRALRRLGVEKFDD